MEQYEYIVRRSYSLIGFENVLNDMACIGWEFHSFTHVIEGSHYYTVVFRRLTNSVK